MAYYKNHKMKKPNLSDRLGLEDGGETARLNYIQQKPTTSYTPIYNQYLTY